MTTYKRNNKTHKSKKDLLTYLDLLLNNNPHNSYDGWAMPTLQMLFNSGSFWQNPSLGLNLSLNTNLGLGLNSMYNLGLNNTPKLSMPSSSSSGKGLIGNSSAAPVYGAAAGMGFDTVDTLLAGGKKTGLGTGAVNAGATLMTSGLSSGNPSLILAGGIVGTAGTIYNAAFGSKKNEKRIALAENEINAVKNFNANASNFDDLLLLIMNAPVITGFSLKDIGSNSLFNKDATKEYNRLNDMREFAEAWKDRSIANAATNLLQLLMNNLLLNYAAYGGLLDYGSSGAIDYDLANRQLGIESMKAMGLNRQYALPNLGLNTFAEGGGIHIKPSKKGTFTAAAKKHGKGVLEFASLVLANKENCSPAMVKKANFARNFGGKKRAYGGYLEGETYDLSELEIANLLNKGYEIEYV